MPRKLHKPLVIKFGSAAVTKPDGGIDKARIRRFSNEIADIHATGKPIVLVSSGAIHSARTMVDWNKSNEASLSELQALSSVGQVELMSFYKNVFAKKNITVAQVLVTHDDLRNYTRYYNLQNTISNKKKKNIIPIINENDAVSFEEISLGDNDQLAAMICENSSASHLIMLTESNGLYDKDPKAKDAQKIDFVAF
ncbi:MAG: glutamate 5-kinase, partial [Bdellovibrionales bacterium]